jgi:hypothetical protein
MNTNNWITWNGGECPVPFGTLVDVQYRGGGETNNIPANFLRWDSLKLPGDVVAYSLVQGDTPSSNECKEFFKKLDKQGLLFETYLYAVMGKFQCDAQQAAKYISEYMKGE